MKRALFFVSLLAVVGPAFAAEAALPQPLPMPMEVAPPKDVPYPGTVKLSVDATDTDHHIFRVHEIVPVTGAGRVTLLYPKWLPGTHAPVGRIDAVAALKVRAGSSTLSWMRDVVDGFAYHVEVPQGAATLDIDFDILSSVDPAQGRVVMTPEMMDVQWTALALYPAGYFIRNIPVEASLKLPEGWQFGSALDVASSENGITTFKPVTFDELADSPLYAGKYYKRVDLDPEGPVPVHLDVVADRSALLDIKPEAIKTHRALVEQAYRLFGSHHYGHYDFLLSLSDTMGGIGLEHHQSSENGAPPTYFTDWDKNVDTRDLLPHEYAHSWNGKFRRPADLWTANFNVPMRDSLLWVYEGQTQYWGFVLAARSGLWTKQQALDAIAATAALYDHRLGREWRPLQDTTNDPVLEMRRPLPWRSFQRAEDYYSEGQLIWLDADTLIREKSGGRKSLDDFARAFFGIDDGSHVPATYTFDDVVETLAAVEPNDWAKFLRTRLDQVGGKAPLEGLARGGYRLIYTDTPSDFFKAAEARRRVTDLTYSLGLVIGREDRLTDVLWQGPAFKAGLTVGTQVVAVNGEAYNADRIKDAIRSAKATSEPIELIVKNGERYRTLKIDYHEGLSYPHLERIAQAPARLDDILAARN